jgi:DNA replication protein DnaC
MSRLGQKMKMICRDCGDEFEVINLGPATSHYCRKCGEVRLKQEEEKEILAKEAEEATRYRQMVAVAQIPPKWKGVTFENSNPDLNPRAFKVARRYAERFTSESPSLIFYSPGNGTGKTHLAACITNYVLHQKRVSVIFKKARDLMLELRHSFADGANMSEADILNKLLSAPLLVLDDVGVDRRTEWLVSTYWTVFDRRVEWQLPVVITTNKPIEPEHGEEALADRIGEGAASRLIELCQGNDIDMTGPDLR